MRKDSSAPLRPHRTAFTDAAPGDVDSCLVIVETTTALPQDADADTVVIGVLADEKIHHDVDGALSGLVAAGEAKAKHRHLAVTHAGGKRWILVGLGKRDELDAERVRVAAASA